MWIVYNKGDLKTEEKHQQIGLLLKVVTLAKLEDLIGSVGRMWRNERSYSYWLSSDLNTRCGRVSVFDSLSLIHMHTAPFFRVK